MSGSCNPAARQLDFVERVYYNTRIRNTYTGRYDTCIFCANDCSQSYSVTAVEKTFYFDLERNVPAVTRSEGEVEEEAFRRVRMRHDVWNERQVSDRAYF